MNANRFTGERIVGDRSCPGDAAAPHPDPLRSRPLGERQHSDVRCPGKDQPAVTCHDEKSSIADLRK